MHILELLWKIVKTYFHYRKGMQAIRTAQGAGQAQDVMMKAYMKGDYLTAALRAPDPFFRGCMLLELGQIGPAQQSLKLVVDSAKETKPGALANSVLGQVFLEDKQYDRALECFRTAQILWQERGFPERWMAEVWLRRSGNEPRGLQWRGAMER